MFLYSDSHKLGYLWDFIEIFPYDFNDYDDD